MPGSNLVASQTDIEARILTVRGKKIILDSVLAGIYGVKTKVLNQAVKRNSAKFPKDFMFQLTPKEFSDLMSHLAASEPENNRSQSVTGSQKHRDPRYLPYAFTEHRENIVRSGGYRSPGEPQSNPTEFLKSSLL